MKILTYRHGLKRDRREQYFVVDAPMSNSESSEGRVGCSDFYYHRGQVLFVVKEFTNAAENYRKSMQLDKGFVFSHIQLAVAKYKSGNVANAMATFHRTLKVFPHGAPRSYYYVVRCDVACACLTFL